MTGLSMAIFQLHMPDVLALKAQLLSDGKTQEEIDQMPLAYFKRRCVFEFDPFASQLVYNNRHAICILSLLLSILSCVTTSGTSLPASVVLLHLSSATTLKQACALGLTE